MSEKQNEYFNCVRADALFLRGRYREAFGLYLCGARDYHDPRAAFDLAYMYHRGIGVAANHRRALTLYAAAVNVGGGAAEFNTALMHMRGQGTAADMHTAAEYMRRAARHGCIEAQMYLGNACLLGCVFDPVDIECLCLIPYHRLIRRVSGSGAVALGGEGGDESIEASRWNVIEADGEKAATYFAEAAELGRLAGRKHGRRDPDDGDGLWDPDAAEIDPEDDFSFDEDDITDPVPPEYLNEYTAGGLAEHEDIEYIREMVSEARFALGRCMAEGVGGAYDPSRGYRLIYGAAAQGGCLEAALYLGQNKETARVYGIDIARDRRILDLLGGK